MATGKHLAAECTQKALNLLCRCRFGAGQHDKSAVLKDEGTGWPAPRITLRSHSGWGKSPSDRTEAVNPTPGRKLPGMIPFMAH